MADESEEKSTAMEVAEEDDDLEDGEIEDDDDDEIVVEPTKIVEQPKVKEKEVSLKLGSSSSTVNNDKKLSSKKSSRIDNDDTEEDIASSIANAIAENLKRKGIEPPMPSVKKSTTENSERSDDQSSSKKMSRNARKRQRRRERQEKVKEDPNSSGGSKKRSKVTEDDGFYMVGGSPQHESSESSYDSYDSEELNRMSYEERRARRREKLTQTRHGGRERSRSREREKRRRSRSRSRSRDRDRDRKERRRDRERDREKDSEKEVCLRFAEYGHCPDEDCNRSHDVRQPKKMELCKFWLMECCAKREKCSYMHGDFPCKYYYLGLKCITKDCKFKHGKPLEDNIKQILLKHLDTAPKEILGDFPRIGRENATKMMAQTHIKLCQEFNVPCPEAEKTKIPSLLDMAIKPPENFSRKNRWSQNESSDKATTSTNDPPTSPGDVVLANLKEILNDNQIDKLAAVGVITVSQINNLTVAQLNEIGLSFATIGEIQATAMNMGSKITNENDDHLEAENEDPNASDMDMHGATTSNENVSETIKSPSSTIMSPNQSDVEDIYKKPEVPPMVSNVLMSPPTGTLDISQYLKDSNLNNDDEEENEPGLKIDENYCTSDYEQEDKKDSQSEDDQQSQDENSSKPFDLLPPSFDSNIFLKATSTKKIDISSSVSQLMEMETPKPAVAVSESPPASRDPRSRDPRKSAVTTPKESSKIPEISSPTYRDPRQQKVADATKKTSIYEIESPSEEDEINININSDKDKDMRLNFMNSDGDVDLRFSFSNFPANYVPATEIEASFGTHIFETYNVKIVDIPKPDYSEIRRSFRQMENTQDPRLKKLCGSKENEDLQTATKMPSIPLNSALPADPRKRRAQEQESTGPKKLQISTILQSSKHYNDLSSSQKMVVNEVLAELTKELKAFHANPSISKTFDASFITQRPKLQQVLIGLGVFVNAEGDFEEIKEVPNLPIVNLPNIQLPPPLIPNLAAPLIALTQPPPNFLRPGIIGLPFNTNNLIEQNDINYSALNQMAFGNGGGDQFNNRGGNGGGNNNNNNNRRDQRQNSNFRNNNNNRNYSRNRRN